MWWRKENLHEALNAAYVGSCDPHVALQSVERSFTVAADGALKMVNGSCLWSDESAAPGMITSGDCDHPQGGWKWTGSASKGEIVHTASSKCLSGSLSLGACGTTPWAQAPSGSANASQVHLSTGSGKNKGTGCLVVVPDNNNNTLGVAVGVADATGSLLPGKTARVSANDTSAGVSLSLSLKSGRSTRSLLACRLCATSGAPESVRSGRRAMSLPRTPPRHSFARWLRRQREALRSPPLRPSGKDSGARRLWTSRLALRPHLRR